MRARVASCARIAWLATLIASSASSAAAQDRIALGDGVSVERVSRPCWSDVVSVCTWWAPVGFVFAPDVGLEGATAFARTARGRIVAALPAIAPSGSVVQGSPVGVRVLYTDDLGATWRLADWPDPLLRALALAFDPGSTRGIAVGEGGGLWSTEDDGATWRRRRSGGGIDFVRVSLRARTVVIGDRNEEVWISRDGGFALESLAPRGARVTVEDGDIVVHDRSRTTRIDARGVVRRD